MNLTSRIYFGLRAIASKPGGIAENMTQPAIVGKAISLTNGAGALQANQLWTGTFSFAGGQSLSQIIHTGLVDAFGDALTPARLKAIYLENTGAQPVTVSGVAGILGSGTLTMRPGEVMLKVAPDAIAYPVSNPTSMTMVNTSNTDPATLQAVLIFASA